MKPIYAFHGNEFMNGLCLVENFKLQPYHTKSFWIVPGTLNVLD